MIDPRDRVTETAFSIAPAIMNAKLASPHRRAAALVVDLGLAAIVAGLGSEGIIAAVAAVVLYKTLMRQRGSTPFRRLMRGTGAGFAALVLFGLSFAFLDFSPDREDDEPLVEVATVDELSGADSVEVNAALQEANMALSSVGLSLKDVVPDEALQYIEPAEEASSEPSSPEEQAQAVVLLNQYAAAFALKHEEALDTLRSDVQQLVAGALLERKDDRIDALDDRVDDLKDENEELKEAAGNPSFVRSARALAADFGLNFGWIGMYFTLLPAFWQGYTPGKRLFGIRIYSLDGKVLTLWMTFERFGGYAAGIVTGTLGFLQIYWDPNRQGVQDKIAGTVVVRMEDQDTPYILVDEDDFVGANQASA